MSKLARALKRNSWGMKEVLEFSIFDILSVSYHFPRTANGKYTQETEGARRCGAAAEVQFRPGPLWCCGFTWYSGRDKEALSHWRPWGSHMLCCNEPTEHCDTMAPVSLANLVKHNHWKQGKQVQCTLQHF